MLEKDSLIMQQEAGALHFNMRREENKTFTDAGAAH